MKHSVQQIMPITRQCPMDMPRLSAFEAMLSVKCRPAIEAIAVAVCQPLTVGRLHRTAYYRASQSIACSF